MEDFGQDMQRLAVYFYEDDGILAQMWATRLHKEFDTMTKLFDCVVLCNNAAKMVSMACHPCHALGDHSAEAYGLRNKDDGGGTTLMGPTPTESPLP